MTHIYRTIVLLGIIALVVSGCGGMARAVKVLPDTADQLCQDTRTPERAKECGPAPQG